MDNLQQILSYISAFLKINLILSNCQSITRAIIKVGLKINCYPHFSPLYEHFNVHDIYEIKKEEQSKIDSNILYYRIDIYRFFCCYFNVIWPLPIFIGKFYFHYIGRIIYSSSTSKFMTQSCTKFSYPNSINLMFDIFRNFFFLMLVYMLVLCCFSSLHWCEEENLKAQKKIK